MQNDQKIASRKRSLLTTDCFLEVLLDVRFRSHPGKPNQRRPVHELFPGAFRNRSSICESCLFSPRKNTRIHTKMGKIHELFILALCLVWFAGASRCFSSLAKMSTTNCWRSIAGAGDCDPRRHFQESSEGPDSLRKFPLVLRSRPPFTGVLRGPGQKVPHGVLFECFWAPASECPKEC